MNKSKRKSLEAAGFQIGDFNDFLDLTDIERELVKLRTNVSIAITEFRKKNNLTQADLAKRIGSSQSRVAKIEAMSADVSLDLMMRSLFAAGGTVEDVVKSMVKKPSRKTSMPA